MKSTVFKALLVSAIMTFGATSLAQTVGKSVEELKQYAKSVTVKVVACPTPEGGRCSVGTGFVVRASEYDTTIVTNKHVCMGASLPPALVNEEFGIIRYNVVQIHRTDSNEIVAGQIMRASDNVDLCLIHTRMLFRNSTKITRRNLANKESVVSFGYSKAKPTWVTGRAFKRRVLGAAIHDETDLQIYGGHSGSAVFNMNGEVVGVIDSNSVDIRTGKVKASWMIPAQHLLEFLGER